MPTIVTANHFFNERILIRLMQERRIIMPPASLITTEIGGAQITKKRRCDSSFGGAFLARPVRSMVRAPKS
jgi:hypothetical protein